MDTNLDQLTDFTAGTDRLQFDNAVFIALTVEGFLEPAALALGTRALDANHRIIYDQNAGIVYYDPDGSGSSGKNQVCVPDSKAALAAADLQVV